MRPSRRRDLANIEHDDHVPELAIAGDAQERERIMLEREVLSRIGGLEYTFEGTTDTHSMGTAPSVHDDDDEDNNDEYDDGGAGGRFEDDESVEYGRHREGDELSIISASFARNGGHGYAGFDYTQDMSYTDHEHTQTQTGNNHPSFSFHQQPAPSSHYQRSEPMMPKSRQPHQMHAGTPGARTDADDTVLRGDTLSTAQHHASGITLGAGLGGFAAGPFTSRTPSRSNISMSARGFGGDAEFDPERKLGDLLATTRAGMSMFEDADEDGAADQSVMLNRRAPTAKRHSPKQSKDQLFAPSFASADPIIVEDTAELDRALEAGRLAFEHAARADRFHDASNDLSEPEDAPSEDSSSLGSWERLRVQKEWNQQQQQAKKHPATQTQSQPQPQPQPRRPSPPLPLPVPRPSSATATAGASKLRDALQHGEFSPRRPRSAQDHYAAPPAPAIASTKARPAKGELDREKRASAAAGRRASSSTHAPAPAPAPRVSKRSEERAARLPDMTGLTSAVETPARPIRKYSRPAHGARGHPADASIVKDTVDNLANKIRELETENITSRRRVRELEHDLDRAQADVVRERTRVQVELRKGKARAFDEEETEEDVDEADVPPLNVKDRKALEKRYAEVVRAKKDLQNTVNELHARLAQMNSRLESYRLTVEDMQTQRAADEHEIVRRSDEVSSLRAEVERLALEVRRLREMIEVKLRERQRRRTASGTTAATAATSAHPGARYAALEEESEDDDEDDLETQLEQSHAVVSSDEEETADDAPVPAQAQAKGRRRVSYETKVQQQQQRDRLSTVSEVDELPSRESIPAPSFERPASRAAHRPATPLVSEDEDEEGEENDFVTGAATHGSLGRSTRRFIDIGELDRIGSELEERRSALESSVVSDTTIRPASPPQPLHRQGIPARQPTASSSSRAGPSRALIPRKVSPSSRPSAPAPAQQEAFPQIIRGSKAERLFFALPEHNETTCRTCRRGHHSHHAPPPSRRSNSARDTEEGQRKMLSTAVEIIDGVRKGRKVDEDALPPQAVMARLLRELEDDFMHYKSTYLELAEQYGAMDPASNALKRNVLADHLREVIDQLESKGDQIAALYDALKIRKSASAAVENVRLEVERDAKGKSRARV